MKSVKRKLLTAMFAVFVLSFCAPLLPGWSTGVLRVEAATPRINKTKVTLKKKTVTLKVSNASKKVKWTSNKPNIVKIVKTSGSKNSKCVIQAVGKGKATITAKVGSKKLKVSVIAKHTHSYTTPATCTSPAKCSCGKTYGTALGHQYAAARCNKRATCIRCGATTGTYAAHSYGSDHKCVWCGLLSLKDILTITPLHTSATGDYNTQYTTIIVTNNGNSTFKFLGGTRTAAIYPSTGAAGINLYLTDRSDNALISTSVLPTLTGTAYYDTLSNNVTYTFTPTGKLIFYCEYGDYTYRITLYIDGSFDFARI